MVKVSWNLWKESYPFICNRCGGLLWEYREICEKCGIENSIRKTRKNDYKEWKKKNRG